MDDWGGNLSLHRKVFREARHALARAGIGVDSLDIRIVRLMLQGNAFSPLNSNFRPSHAQIAKAIGADEDTVRYRVRKMHSSGFFGEWRLMVNPRIWGGGQIAVLIDLGSDSPKEDILDKLKLVPGAVFLNSYYERLAITMDYDVDATLPRQIELVRRLSGSTSIHVGRVPLPNCERKPTPGEWDVIRALRKNPRSTYSELAKKTGLSGRTVRRRLSGIKQQGFAFAWPTIDLRAVDDKILVMLSVQCPWDRRNGIDEAIQTHLEPHLWHVMHMLPFGPREMQPTGYDLAVSNIGEAREILEWVRSILGVRVANIDLYENIYIDFCSYDEYLDGKLREMPTARSR